MFFVVIRTSKQEIFLVEEDQVAAIREQLKNQSSLFFKAKGRGDELFPEREIWIKYGNLNLVELRKADDNVH